MVRLGAVIRWLAWLTFRLLMLWAVAAVVLLAAIYVYGRQDYAAPADVIIVLGSGLLADDQPGPALYRRTAQAADLWRADMASALICTGGVGPGRARSEADACADLLREQGIPDAAIHLEELSRSTEENALYAQEIMQQQDWHSAIVVSDAYHLLRATWVFRRAEIEHVTSPAAMPPMDNYIYSVLREVIAFNWLAYKWVFNLPVTHISLL